MRVAFLGLGIMGRPMAASLVRAGHEVSVWNRTPKEVEGARLASSPADAVTGAEVVWMCVSDTKAVEAVLFGPQGVDSAIGHGAIVVDSSTISPSAELHFAQRLRAKGVLVFRNWDYRTRPIQRSPGTLHGFCRSRFVTAPSQPAFDAVAMDWLVPRTSYSTAE